MIRHELRHVCGMTTRCTLRNARCASVSNRNTEERESHGFGDDASLHAILRGRLYSCTVQWESVNKRPFIVGAQSLRKDGLRNPLPVDRLSCGMCFLCDKFEAIGTCRSFCFLELSAARRRILFAQLNFAHREGGF